MSSESKPLSASCHCGAVTIEIDLKPNFINDCDCSLCKKCGGPWGYFEPSQCTVTGETEGYTRADSPDPAVEIQFCRNCGATTHWTLTDSYKAKSETADKMGVNMALFTGADLTGVELRFPDGKNWFGGEAYGYRREPIIITADTDI